jgi:hypothetical protein
MDDGVKSPKGWNRSDKGGGKIKCQQGTLV